MSATRSQWNIRSGWAKPLDSRGYPVRGLWERYGVFYEVRLTGFGTKIYLPLLTPRGLPVKNVTEAKLAMQRRRREYLKNRKPCVK